MNWKSVDSNALAGNFHPKHNKYFLKDLVVKSDSGLLSVHRGRIEPGGEIFVHTHEIESETFYILSGRLECTMGEEKIAYAAGSCGFAPPGIPHGLRNTGDVPAELVAIFTPPLK